MHQHFKFYTTYTFPSPLDNVASNELNSNFLHFCTTRAVLEITFALPLVSRYFILT